MLTSAPNESPESKELGLVGKVELRVALADSDAKLESILKTYLPPLLLKLASDYTSVRNKVRQRQEPSIQKSAQAVVDHFIDLELNAHASPWQCVFDPVFTDAFLDTQVISVCQHINTRVKPQTIKLPLAALLKQFKDNDNALIRHFDLLYIQQGVDRIPKNDRISLLPNLIRGLHSNYDESTTNAARLFNLLLKILHSLSLPTRGSPDDVTIRAKVGLSESIEDADFVAMWLGLSVEDCSFLQVHGRKDTWMPNASGGMNLIETKVVAAKFLSCGAFTDSERFIPALFASADPNSRLSDIGDDILKRATSSVSLEDRAFLEKLFVTYLGTRGSEGSLPARAPLQTKILALLSRSKLSSSFVSQSIQIVREGLDPEMENGNGITGPSKQGLETSKLRGQIFAFTNWLARISPPEDIRTFAPNLVFQLRGYIESQGWPRLQTDGPRPKIADLSSRSYGYESIGLLAAACPDSILLEPNLDMLRWLFSSLSADPSGSDISISIEQALGSVLGAFGQDLDPELEAALTSILLRQMTLRPGEAHGSNFEIIRSTRFVAVRFANRCLPYRNVTARWINLLAIGGDANDRSEVKEEGKKGLDPYWYRMSNPLKVNLATKDDATHKAKYKFPAFSDLVEKFFGPGAEWDVQRPEGTQVSLPSAYNPAISFCRSVLLYHALSPMEKAPDINADWERNVDALVTNDEEFRAYLKNYMSILTTDRRSLEALQTYLAASFRSMTDQISQDSNRSGDSILELAPLCPDPILDELMMNVSRLQSSVLSIQKPIRDTATRVFGILASREQCSKETVQSMLHIFDQKIQFWRQAIGTEILKVHGALLATAYFISRLTYRGIMRLKYDELRVTFVISILDILSDSRDKILLDAAVIAFADLCLFGSIFPGRVPPPHSISVVLQKLKELSRNGNEKAIIALGNLAMQCDEIESEGSTLDSIIQILYDLQDVRQPEVQFAVGSSLSCAAVGWRSKSLIAALDIDGPLPQTPKRERTLPKMFEKVMLDCRTTKPALRQASVIWLLCLVQYCGHLEDAQTRLRKCQSIFKGFLSDRESLNQESASRGLTLVYEKGNRSLKDDLIRDLVGSFTGTNAGLAGKVSDETQLFEPGALPTGEGSVTTYKDIMGLASEVGDPGLVYRFMSLASNNAIWSSRAAFGKFGLSSILSDSSVDGYLARNPKLYPALFRYRFDPNTNVRQSMNDIWNALVKDPAAIIALHFDGIIDDLLKNILGKEWRVRQASCAAIADLIQGRPLEKYEKYLSQIWTVTFKVCDDIKDSVRIAAMSLAKVLTGVLTRSLEAADSSTYSANKMLKEVVPFLLSPSGLESSAKDVQAYALLTLLQIIKSSNGRTLRPFVPNLIEHLLALLSSLEPEEVNYIHLNAGQYDLTTQQIDDARLNSVRGSPMMEAIERCLDILDEETMAVLCPSLENAIKTAIGLPSKVGSTRVLVSLSTRHNYIFKKYADQFLRLVRKQVLDRNDTVSSSYAVGCGYLARLASEAETLNLVQYCEELYFDSDDDRHRSVSGDIIYAFSKNATDRFKSIVSNILPFVFIAKHDASERVKDFFQDTWNENAGGSLAVLLYLKEIVNLASLHLDSPRWSVKHTSALAIADVVNSSGSEISDSDARMMWPTLEKATSGKTWEGKEIILQSLVRFVRNSRILSLDEGIAKQIQTIVLRESKRNNPDYRRHALVCLGDLVELQRTTDLFSQIYSITEPIIIQALDSSDEMDVDSLSKDFSSKLLTEINLANSLGTLLKSIDPQLQSEPVVLSSLSQSLDLLEKALSVNGSRLILDSIYDAERGLFERLNTEAQTSLTAPLEEVLVGYVKTMFSQHDRVEQTRMKAAEASIAVAPLARKSQRIALVLAHAITDARREERSASIHQCLDRAQKMLEE